MAKLEKLEPEIREVAAHLRGLGKALRSGKIELRLAAELANIYGKELKAHGLILGERVFFREKPLPQLQDFENEQT